MDNMINFGIDLGTTNSAIAKFVKGDIEIFSNPLDYGKRTLPSVIAFKKDKIIVGSKAKERYNKDPKNVVGVFKRKMGTTESYPIKALKQSKTPIDLSALVLKELKTFVQSGEKIEAAVITIPASFDTIQSNATKEAGFQAGFKQVVLLQEPIAASLAYANKTKEKELEDGQWLVYDFGGGTFDVALVKIQDGEMKVLDHEGDNFQGGADFDRLIVEKIIIPKLEEEGDFSDLKQQMQSASGKYNTEYFQCLYVAEKAKIELSAHTSTEMEVQIEDEDGEELDLEITITRSEFEDLIKEYVDTTIKMVQEIITRNSLTTKDLQFVLMVGGTTFIPFVRQRVAEIIGVEVNTDIDPTTAVAVGAAYFAGTKKKELKGDKKTTSKTNKSSIQVKMAYEKSSKEPEEFFAAKISGNIDGFKYRIDREDGGFSTGLKPLKKQISEELPLVKDSFNFFTLHIYDADNNLVETDAESIGINSGFIVSGQPLPKDICIEVDDPENPGLTKLELVFEKNTILPAKRTFTKSLNKTIQKGSEDSVIINILEGSHTAIPSSNRSIGFLQINESQLSRNLAKGSDLEITIEMTESRDLIISYYLVMLDQEFKEVFNAKQRDTNVTSLKHHISTLSENLQKELNEAIKREDFETADDLKKLSKEIEEIEQSINELSDDDVTDAKYQIEDKKSKLAQEIDNATKGKRIQIAVNEYKEVKEKCKELVDEYGNDAEKQFYYQMESAESTFLNSNTPYKIEEKTDELRAMMGGVMWRTPGFLIAIYRDLLNNIGKMNNQDQAKTLFDAGKFAIQNENWDRLAEVNQGLISLLPRNVANEVTGKIGF